MNMCWEFSFYEIINLYHQNNARALPDTRTTGAGDVTFAGVDGVASFPSAEDAAVFPL